MLDNPMFQDISKSQREITEDIFDLVLERIIKNFYLQLGDEDKQKMGKTFLSNDKKSKEDFISKNFTDPEFVFKQELEKVIEEIKTKLKANKK